MSTGSSSPSPITSSYINYSKGITILCTYFFSLPFLGFICLSSLIVYTTAKVGGLYFKAKLIGVAGIRPPSKEGTE